KDDAFAGAKAFHKTFIKQFDEFDPIAKKYIAEITIMSGQHAANEIKATEKKEGKSIKYYTLLTMQEAETLNDAVADDSFDVAAVSKQLADFEEHTQQLGDKTKVDMDKHQHFPGFIDRLEKFQGKVKKRIRRVRDNVAYTAHEQDYLNSGSGDMVDGSYEAVVKAYNELINTYNSYHLEREF
ncbi:YiiG family protein, partial [Salmonella enterica]|nr:YiiG family protein [Salmonella enterica]